MPTFLKIAVVAPFSKVHPDVNLQTFFDMKIRLRNQEDQNLKHNITGIREVEILKITQVLVLFTRKETDRTKN